MSSNLVWCSPLTLEGQWKMEPVDLLTYLAPRGKTTFKRDVGTSAR